MLTCCCSLCLYVPLTAHIFALSAPIFTTLPATKCLQLAWELPYLCGLSTHLLLCLWPSAASAARCPADETSRENYEKYGHPDGPQSLNMGVALPEWMFAADSKAAPLLLIGLVSLCVLLPLVVMAWFLSNSTKYMGSSGVTAETLDIFFRFAPLLLLGPPGSNSSIRPPNSRSDRH